MKGSTVPADYIVYVKTGDRKGAGTGADVYLALYNTEGKRSREIKLEGKWWKDEFGSGKIDSFPVDNVPNFGTLDKLEVWTDGGDDWYVERISVEDAVTKERTPFPVHRWVKKGKKVRI